MYAEISVDGTLMIEPETPTEAYALKSWWDAYTGEADKRAGLRANYNQLFIRDDEQQSDSGDSTH